VYTREQFEEWMQPIDESDVRGLEVLELGCGNASLLMHLTHWSPARLEGVELGAAVGWGLDAVIRNTKPGGRFHCWVYAREGNAAVRYLVEPLRRVCSRLPWWLTKYAAAAVLSAPCFLYAKALARLPRWKALERLPLYHYSLWIARRDFGFFWHVVFDQLVTPRTVYVPKATIEEWLSTYENLEQDSLYILPRNGNSWKFGGRVARARTTVEGQITCVS
jgi:hypothetical protein